MIKPDWITKEISPYDLAGILQGGCASGAYMPAVEYYAAGKVMAEHGDAVLDYINEVYGEMPAFKDLSWSGMAVAYLSLAVETWACGCEALANWEDDNAIVWEEAA